MSKYYDKTAASFKSVTIDTKVLDAQKILVKPSTSDSTERVNILDLINEAGESADTTELDQRISALEDLVEGYKSVEFKSNTTGNSNETEGIAMQFSKAHFIPGNAQLQQVSLPFTQAVKTLTNQYCHIAYYNDAEEVIATHISNTTQSRTQGQTGKSTWTFPESCIVPESYKYVRVCLSGVDYAVNFGITSKYRINVVNKGGVDFDDDECCVWTSTSNSPNYLGDIEVTYGVHETILDTITSIESDLNSRIDEITDELTDHIGDDTHLTTEQKNAISGYLSHVGDSTHLTTEDRTLLSNLANNGSKSYDWTPNIDLKIQFSLANDYTTPVNGWLVINSNTTDDNQPWSFTVNGKQSFNSDQRGNLPVQILLSKNDVISTDSTGNRICYFLPCKSEVLDYRITNTPYDIWANAVVEDENGNLSVQNLHVPDASQWTNETPQEVRNSIVRVEDEVAYDENNNLVCNIQSSEIVNGSYVFDYCSSITSFSSDLSNLKNGSFMFNNCILLTSFNNDLSSLINGNGMFNNCTNLNSFSGDLSNLEIGTMMFSSTPINLFSGDLGSLTNGQGMFNGCSNLTQFSGDLSNLEIGSMMFSRCSNLPSFSGDLSSLGRGDGMFTNCTNLTSFSGDLSSLIDGQGMFNNAPLTSFSSNLSSLINGQFMFGGCNLDADSVRNITLTINNVTDDPVLDTSTDHNLDLGVNTSILTNTQTKNDFGIIIYKGWDLMVNNSSNFDYNPWSSQKYNGCINVTNVETAEPNYPTVDIVNGKWTEHLCELQNGTRLFFGFTHLTSFSGDLSSLVNGKNMFHFCTGLTSFNSDLSSLVDGSDMFSSCVSLTSFKSNLSSLVNGYYMFHGCNALTSFRGNLSSLTNGYAMFTGGCELDTESIKCIADTIKDVTGLTNSSSYTGTVYKQIFIDTVNSVPTEEEKGYFNTIASKGWTVIANGDTYAPIN